MSLVDQGLHNKASTAMSESSVPRSSLVVSFLAWGSGRRYSSERQHLGRTRGERGVHPTPRKLISQRDRRHDMDHARRRAKRLAEKLLQIRKALGLSQHEMAG